MTRACTKCGVVKCVETEFQQASGYADGHRRQCKECVERYRKTWAATDKGRAGVKQQNIRRKEIKAAWHQRNKARLLEHNLARRKTDVRYKLYTGLRTRLNVAIKANVKSGSAVRDLGCSIPELKAHLERLWQPGMTWENWAINGWHIDHIRPLASFDLSDPAQLKRACHFTNLQPLWAVDNWHKNKSLTP